MVATVTPGQADWSPDRWDSYVRTNPRATYLQTTAWSRVKRTSGWTSQLIVGESAPHGVVGAQVLTRPVPLVPWTFAYAPRGPLVDAWSVASLAAWTGHLRGAGSLGGAAVFRMDPEIESSVPFEDGAMPAEALAGSGWQQARDVQPRTTRIIDLDTDESALWSGLRKKWRQYVNRARSLGIVVRDVDAGSAPDAFAIFHRVMRETSARASVPIRAESAYRELWSAFQPTGESRLLFADDSDGRTLAVLLLVESGGRVVEPYGGMTEAGADMRANYLLKWEAIRSSRERGAVSYDLWGLVHPGIAHFKQGFGGREVGYVGAWDLPLSAAGDRLFRIGEWGQHAIRGGLRRLRGAPVVPGSGADPDV